MTVRDLTSVVVTDRDLTGVVLADRDLNHFSGKSQLGFSRYDFYITNSYI